jgi:glycosyl transferase family 25
MCSIPIFYINLDHRKDRNEEIQEEFTTMGITNYERFPAVHHETIGGVGCGRSHVNVLKMAKERGYKQVIVLEDDFLFLVSKKEWICAMENLHTNLPCFDVCLLSYQLIKSESCIFPSFTKITEAQTTSGYIINEHYYDTLIQVFENASNHFETTNHHWLYAIDVAWKSLQRRDHWYGFSPKLGKQRASYSDCGNTFNDVGW